MCCQSQPATHMSCRDHHASCLPAGAGRRYTSALPSLASNRVSGTMALEGKAIGDGQRGGQARTGVRGVGEVSLVNLTVALKPDVTLTVMLRPSLNDARRPLLSGNTRS